MKLSLCVVAAAVSVAAATFPATVPAPVVVTVMPSPNQTAPHLHPADVTAAQDKATVPVTQVDRLTGALADMQLFILLDDSTRSSSLGLQLQDLKSFIESLPPSTQVAIGYMKYGTFGQVHAFTSDHDAAAASLRLPMAVPGANGSPYFALGDLVKHWPDSQPATRRAVLMFTDGVDPYYTSSIIDDPYLDTTVREALKQNIAVYSVYLRGAGRVGRSLWGVTMAQSRLIEVSDSTGGHAYFQEMSDPVSIVPFLTDLRERFANQYRLILEARPTREPVSLKFNTELPGVKIEGPSKILAH